MVHVGLMVVGLACAVGLGVSCGSAAGSPSSSSFVASLGLAHLLSHSFAKASLFCCVGVLLHGALSQDLRDFGATITAGLRRAKSHSRSPASSGLGNLGLGLQKEGLRLGGESRES